MREHSGELCEMFSEVLLCLFYRYPCCDLFCGVKRLLLAL